MHLDLIQSMLLKLAKCTARIYPHLSMKNTFAIVKQTIINTLKLELYAEIYKQNRVCSKILIQAEKMLIPLKAA
jgi:hypothetical protein